MAGFFHFIPESREELLNGRRPRRDVLARYGLADVLSDIDDCPDDAVITETAHGPGGQAGVTLYPKSATAADPPGWGYRPDHQIWQRIERWGRWLGYEIGSLPDPEELERKIVFRDYSFIDKLGRKWYCPCARSRQAFGSSLPVEYGFDAAGVVVRRVAPEYDELWALSGEVLDVGRELIERDEAWHVQAALKCLQANYRIGWAEAEILRTLGAPILSRESVFGILGSLVDRDLEQEAAAAMVDATKKNNKRTPGEQSAPASPSASNGRAAACRATPQAAEH